MTDETLTIAQFCAAEKISRSTFYKLCEEGKAPRTFNVGTKRLISHEARQEWRRARKAEAAVADGQLATIDPCLRGMKATSIENSIRGIWNAQEAPQK